MLVYRAGESSKRPCLPPEVTSRLRDVNKDAGGVNERPHPLINMQIYVNDLINMQITCKSPN